MKAIKNILFTMIALAMVLVVSPTQAEASLQNGAGYTMTDTGFTVYWEAPASFNYSIYTLDSYYIQDKTTGEYIMTDIPADTTSVNFTAGKGFTGYWYIGYNYTYVSSGSHYEGMISYISINTKPVKMSTSNFGLSAVYSSSKKVWVESAKVETNSYNITGGVEMKIYKGSSCVKTIKSSYRVNTDVSIYTNKVYKYKCRAYYVNNDTQKTTYGDWSSYRYFNVLDSKYSTKYGVRGAKVTLKRVSGLSKYVIYVSTKKDSGYKKTMTVKNPSSSSKTVSITKIGSNSLKKGKTYYVKIYNYIKVGSSTKKSDAYATFSFYNYK